MLCKLLARPAFEFAIFSSLNVLTLDTFNLIECENKLLQINDKLMKLIELNPKCF